MRPINVANRGSKVSAASSGSPCQPGTAMARLIVGFDSAWTRTNAGAVAGALVTDSGAIYELGEPAMVDYRRARDVIAGWQLAHAVSSTLVLLDQPTIVVNDVGQRPVERIVCSVVGRRRGGVQPANKGRRDMFGVEAPVWEFLTHIEAAVDPFAESASVHVLETYPVLVMIALGWTLFDSSRPTGRLPKYNPGRRKTFSIADWAHVCRTTAAGLAAAGAPELARWAATAANCTRPTKSRQDQLDACICLLVGLHLAQGDDGLFVGCRKSGYIVVPSSDPLRSELAARCLQLKLDPDNWVQPFARPLSSGGSRHAANITSAVRSSSRLLKND